MQKSPGMANSISSVGMRTIGIQQCILFVQHAFSLPPRLYCCCSTIVVVVVVFFIIILLCISSSSPPLLLLLRQHTKEQKGKAPPG